MPDEKLIAVTSDEIETRLTNIQRTDSRLREWFKTVTAHANEMFGTPTAASGRGAITLEVPESATGSEFALKVFGRRLRIWLDFSYENRRGFIVIDDVTRPGAKPIRVARVAFDANGVTDVSDPDDPARSLRLTEPANTWVLMMSIVDRGIRVTLSDHPE